MLTAPSSAQVWGVNMTFPSVHNIDHLYFVTASISGWRHLLAEPKYVQIVLDCLVWFQNEKTIILFAFVIMPSHLHLIIKPEGKTVGDILQEFGSYTAHAILHQLRADKRSELLNAFHQQRRDARHRHSIWQDIQAKNIYSHTFLSQKMDYIHSNPVSKKWKLVDDLAPPRTAAGASRSAKNAIYQISFTNTLCSWTLQRLPGWFSVSTNPVYRTPACLSADDSLSSADRCHSDDAPVLFPEPVAVVRAQHDSFSERRGVATDYANLFPGWRDQRSDLQSRESDTRWVCS